MAATMAGSPPNVLLNGTFVGRARELATLRAAFDDACLGRGRMVLVTGDPGIGKTRLCDELTRHAEAHGACVLWGRCWEEGGAVYRSAVSFQSAAGEAPTSDI